MFFSAGLALLLAGAVAALLHAVTDVTWLRWTALHLVLLGGVSQLVLGAAQFFVGAFLATDPPPRRLIHAQLAAWNAGTLLVTAGMALDVRPLVDAGGVLIVLGLALFALGLRAMQRSSLQQARWAIRWYQAGAACLALGAVLGMLMAGGLAWSHGSLLGAHLALNLGGWLGTAIVGTLHTFFPSLTGTRLRFPRLQAPAFRLWLAGVAALAVGAAFAVTAIVAAGWLALAVAATLLGANVVAGLRGAPQRLAIPPRLIAVATGFLLAGTLAALVVTLADGAWAPFVGARRSMIAALLLVGWVGLTVAGSLLHLLAVLRRVRGGFGAPLPVVRPRLDTLLTAAAALAITALAVARAAAADGPERVATVAVLAVAGVLALRIGGVAVGALRPRPVGRRPGSTGAPPLSARGAAVRGRPADPLAQGTASPTGPDTAG